MFYQIFHSHQLKQWAIITYKHGINELPHDLTLFRIGGGKKPPPPSRTRFSPVTSTNVGTRPQNFLNLSFNAVAPAV